MRKVEFFLLSVLAITAFFFTSFIESYAAEPTKPRSLTADAVSPTQIDLTWEEPSDNGGSSIIGYYIEVNIDNAGYADLEQDTNNDDTTYSHKDLTTGTIYKYRVSAINADGLISDASDSASTIPTSTSSPPVEDQPPDAPTALKASPTSTTKIFLTWNEPINDGGEPITGYKIEVQVGSGSFTTLVDNSGTTSRTYSHTGLSSGTEYTYKVYAINSIGPSGASFEASATPKLSDVPTGLTAKAVSSGIELSWNAPTQTYGFSIIGYKIEVELSSGAWDEVKTTSSSSTSTTISGLEVNTKYTFKVSANFSNGSSSPESDEASATTSDTTGPADTVPDPPTELEVVASSPTRIDLSWNAPTDNGGEPIIGYKIEFVVESGSYEPLEENTGTTARTYSHDDLTTDSTYSYKVYAINSIGTSGSSDIATTTPRSTSGEPEVGTEPSSPINLRTTAVSQTKIDLIWNAPADDGGDQITGYKIVVKVGGAAFDVLKEDTGNTDTTYSHTGLLSDTKYSYLVFAINSIGISDKSNQVSSTTSVPEVPEEPDPEEPEPDVPSFIDPELGAQFYLDRYYDEPDYKEWFDSNCPDYTIEEAIELAIPDSSPEETEEPESAAPDFIDPELGAQHYLDRYYDEPAYKAWFDSNFPDYTIEEAIELAIPDLVPEETETKPILPFVDPERDPQYYINRYNNDSVYQEWFDENFPDYTIYEAIGVEPPEQSTAGKCGEGTILVDGECVVEKTSGGGCLIATAAFGSELAPQVQQLREIRDNTLLETESGSSFMAGFNEFYYSFSPTIADWERQNPVFKEIVKLGVTPLITSLSILNYVDINSELEMLVYGISLILLNVGMYFVAPAIIIHRVRKLV